MLVLALRSKCDLCEITDFHRKITNYTTYLHISVYFPFESNKFPINPICESGKLVGTVDGSDGKRLKNSTEN